MPEDIRAFLNRFTVDDLTSRGVLRPSTWYGHLLRAPSVLPLVDLMKENNVSRLEALERDWYLTSEYEFRNPSSSEQIAGDARDLANPGNVFNLQNKHINPFFGTPRAEDISDVELQASPEIPVDDSGEIKFGLERDLQRALRSNISQLDPGLRIIDGGVERSVAAGRIDITAEDDKGNLVVIELKAGTAQPESIAQLLAYMGTIENDQMKPIRGILVANDFHPRLVFAARAAPNISLKAYSFQFSFDDR
jgi:hypothetical protein